MGRLWLAGLCAVVGVGVLAGPGWALLAAGAVLYVTPIPARLRRWAVAARDGSVRVSGRAWRWLMTGRHQVAMAATPAALLLLPIGAGLSFGVGWSLMFAGAMLAMYALLLGWDSRPAP